MAPTEARWVKNYAGSWSATDAKGNRWTATLETVPESCAGPHPSPHGGGSSGTWCDGDWMHEVPRWLLTPGGPEDVDAEIVLIVPTLRACKRYVG